MAFFPIPDPKKSFPETEHTILEFWKKEQIFRRSIESRTRNNPFLFFDGPPFATGTPHYGHILAGAIKDAIPRYMTMKGARAERRFGWDCHGVPVEFQVEKEHKIGGKPGIEKMGVDKFNELCRSIVLRCRDEWEETVERMGRFVDFENDYKTMDPDFMESVWWVFRRLWDKGLIYEGEKVVAYSPKLGSPLSNFEAGQNYRDISDPAVTVSFQLKDEPNTYLLAWTTTPWTLPSNLGLCVNPKNEYAIVEKEGKKYILGKNLVEKFFGEEVVPIEIVHGKNLLNKEYIPLFPFFENHEKAFRVLGDDFVGEDEGTGIVHMAPNFGEEDSRVCHQEGIHPLQNPIDENGYFDSSIPEMEGLYFREDETVPESKANNANKWVLENLGDKLFRREQITHSYPHCWRTDCALMYRGVKTWFVNIQKIKDQLIAQNKNINWVPSHLQEGRFGKGLESAPDWAISRNRYWGAPLPVWRCDKTGEVHVVGSREELELLSGKKVKDLHKHFVDDITWKNEKTGGTMRRIEEVLDCWFESGSMPYGSHHFPFEHSEWEANFPQAGFIAEGLDQTRGWFYTLHVLGVALWGKNIYQNVVTNGIVLAEDGQKMSKSKKNYPDPNLVFDKYGADAMRFYLLSNPVVRGENFRFAERGVEEVLKSVLLPIRNAYQFFASYAEIDGWTPTRIVLVRHGEGDHNVQSVYSGNPENKHHLTAKGKKEVQSAAQYVPTFDAFYASPFVRTQETADILRKELHYTGEIMTDRRLRESCFGDLEGQTFNKCGDRFHKAKNADSVADIIARSRDFIQDIRAHHEGQTVLAVTHGDTFSGMNLAINEIDDLPVQDFLNLPKPVTASTAVYFPLPQSENELDRWILSELQTTLSQYRDAFDRYSIDEAVNTIPPFIDKLNNWYLRRSRRRFWAEGLDDDKKAAYATLHSVLLTLSKLLAPVCPFFAEQLYKDLGGGLSVHLEWMPMPIAARQEISVQDRINLTREIVSLAASIRAQQKIKLRQPLQTLQFATGSTTEVDLDMIAQEANVKEVIRLEHLEGVAERIVKVDARAVGPRLGAKVQDLIRAGKEGRFEELSGGQIKIEGEILSPEEYSVGFLCAEGVAAESSSLAVVLLDTHISADLESEGWAREIIRLIQTQRKEQDFDLSDRISVTYKTDSEKLKSAFAVHTDMIKSEVLALQITIQEDLDAETFVIDGEAITLALTLHN